MTLGTILAMGGGGFSMEPDNPLLDDFLLSLAPGGDPPRICFVPTASGDSETYADRFLATFAEPRARASVLSLFHREVHDLRSFVLAQDIVYVGGGNTANLLALWRRHGLDEILVEAHRAGVVLGGLSAGMICWFGCSVTDSFGADNLQPLHEGLGLLAGSACPHYDGEPGRRPTYHALVGSGELPAGYAADDGCALLFRGTELAEAVSSRPGAGAYEVRRTADGVSETPLPVRFLGSTDDQG